MSDKDEVWYATYDDFGVAKKAVQRWLYDVGRKVEQTCRLLRSNDGARFHVYETRVKEKRGSQEGVLLMLKAFGEDGAVIAFHQDSSHLQAFMNVGERLANGSLKFEPDQYPPKDYDSMVAEYLARVEYFKDKVSHP